VLFREKITLIFLYRLPFTPVISKQHSFQNASIASNGCPSMHNQKEGLPKALRSADGYSPKRTPESRPTRPHNQNSIHQQPSSEQYESTTGRIQPAPRKKRERGNSQDCNSVYIQFVCDFVYRVHGKNLAGQIPVVTCLKPDFFKEVLHWLPGWPGCMHRARLKSSAIERFDLVRMLGREASFL
jgi:hypothetical protein